jgi:hypothetical protein
MIRAVGPNTSFDQRFGLTSIVKSGEQRNLTARPKPDSTRDIVSVSAFHVAASIPSHAHA